VSRSGVTCGEYADCLDLLTANRNIDYDGNGGPVQIGMEGDPQVARFQVFTFDPTGLDQTNGRTVTP
jgi:branched-chain amino acid transport system substrate-binding protein